MSNLVVNFIRILIASLAGYVTGDIIDHYSADDAGKYPVVKRLTSLRFLISIALITSTVFMIVRGFLKRR